MKAHHPYNIESVIDNTLEMSGVCRGEWCRALESKVDRLDDELDSIVRRSESNFDTARVEVLSDKIRRAYRNLGPDIHI